ncbi:hypothetical protein MTR67_017432, partial [Solanum verrucosum]
KGDCFFGFAESWIMAVPWSTTLWMAKMVWMALSGWVVSCLTIADEVAASFRTGDIGPFHGIFLEYHCTFQFSHPTKYSPDLFAAAIRISFHEFDYTLSAQWGIHDAMMVLKWRLDVCFILLASAVLIIPSGLALLDLRLQCIRGTC